MIIILLSITLFFNIAPVHGGTFVKLSDITGQFKQFPPTCKLDRTKAYQCSDSKTKLVVAVVQCKAAAADGVSTSDFLQLAKKYPDCLLMETEHVYGSQRRPLRIEQESPS